MPLLRNHIIREVEKNKRINMVGNGLTPRLRAVMQSWGLNLATNISAASDVSAWTDFSVITVNYDRRLTQNQRDFRATDLPVISVEDLRQIAAETRGLFYHELGHNLFTVPLVDLLTLAWEQGYVVTTPHDTEVPLVRLRNEPTPVNSRHLSHADRIEYPNWDITGDFQRAWNILEDQRMEVPAGRGVPPPRLLPHHPGDAEPARSERQQRLGVGTRRRSEVPPPFGPLRLQGAVEPGRRQHRR
jgi:hypothetical protein